MEERFNRLEKRFDHMEGMLSQLIAMVGKIHEEQMEMKKDISSLRKEQQEMKQDISSLRKEQQEMKQDISSLRKEQQEMKQDISFLRNDYLDMRMENDHRHSEVMRKFRSLEIDHEYTWGKTEQHEREIARLKRQQIGS